MQQGMLYHSRYTAEPEVYFTQFTCTLEGDLDREAFARAWQRVLDRHPALRTTFHWQELDKPLQVVHRKATLPFEHHDWRDLGPAEQRERLEELLKADRRRGFDLGSPPLLRLSLVDLGRAGHQLIWSFHHLLLDGWSIPLVLKEVFLFYNDSAADLPRPRPFRDYILWLQRQDLTRSEAFWRQALAGFPAPTPLRLGESAHGSAGAAGPGRHEVHLPAAVTAALRELGRSRQLTLSTLVQGVWALLLARTSGEEDVLFGVTSSGRPPGLPGVESMVGLFINTLPVRLRVSLAEPLLPWLRGLQGLTAEMREHEHSPLVAIQGWSEVPRGVPLFASLVIYESFPADSSAPAGGALAVRAVRPFQKTNYPVTLVASPQGESLRLRIVHDLARVDGTAALRALEHLRTLLVAMPASADAVEDPASRLGDLPLLTAPERQALLIEWNDTRGPAGAPPGHRLFEASAARTPGAPALVWEGRELSFGEVDARANRLARRLRRLGVGPEVRVALALRRSAELLIAILAVWKAGGAYLPLDPTHPPERLAGLLAESGARVLVATGQEPLLPAGIGPNLARVDPLDPDLLAESADTLPPVAGEEDESGRHLAYLLYTSGSTGKPKGVMVEHRGLANLTRSQIPVFGITPASRVLLFASATFDSSVSELLPAWTAGAAVVFAPEHALLPGAGLLRLLTEERVTNATFPPSVLAALPAADLSRLTTLVVMGEAATGELLGRWLTPGRRVIDAYGPTEATVCATMDRVGEEVREGVARPTIGRPILNTRVYVVQDFTPLPIGAAGELLLGGINLARGYFGRGDLTAERFLPDPWGEPGGRLYRTGDLVRWLPDGRLDFLGRIDRQVKVRGFRIETGEVEAALARHPAVREAVVATHATSEEKEETGVDLRLVAWVTPREGQAVPGAGELRSFLAGLLPEYMIPSLFVPLADLPRNANGKVDRRALPAPLTAAPGEGHRPPETDLERFLAGLWCEVLRVEAVSVDDNFFALGGHSITGALLVNRLQEKLGEIVHVVVMFDAPTVSGQAAYLVENYPEAVVRKFGEAAIAGAFQRGGGTVDAAKIAEIRRRIAPLPPRPASAPAPPRNPPAVFVLSPPRSGSTLLRVMLAGNPRLFAPPELELLSFNTLAERRAAFPGRNAFWLEGAVRAVMAVRSLPAEEAEALLASLEREGGTTQDLYRLFQEWIGDRILVDKTPSYALDEAVLERAEETFEDARYIHLLRHPAGMIHSFEEAKLEQVFFRHPHRFARRELAELIWLVCHENILRFLEKVPAERRLRVRFEDLLARPTAALEEICAFLGVDFHPDMALPYKEEKGARMTDGIHAWSRMLGDVKFHSHGKVDPGVAERWRESLRDPGLGEETAALAAALGYPVSPAAPSSPSSDLAIPRRPEGLRDLPLSFAQERLWFLDRLQPGSPAYNIPAAVRLTGALDVAAFRRALSEVVRRHEALRTTFTIGEEGPVQVIAEDLVSELPRVDLRQLSTEAREAEIRRLAAAEARRPFDLARGPLLRSTLLETGVGGAEHVLLLNLHHIVADGWSMGVLIQEAAALYAAFARNLPSPLPPLPVQYADFALWQRQRLRGAALEAELAYWRQTLAGAATLELPTDRPRPPVQRSVGAYEPFELPADKGRALLDLGRREGATPYITLLAAFQTLLHRYTGQDDLVVGTTIAGRNHRDLERLIGFFVNSVPMRTDLSVLPGRPSFRSLLARVREAALGALAHQELPFEKLVAELQPERDLSRSPLFQVVFQLQNAPAGEIDLPGLSLRPVESSSGTAKFDLLLSLREGAEGITGSWNWNTDLFDRPTVARMSAHLGSLIAAIVADPERQVSELPLLTAAERQQLLAVSTRAALESDADCLHRLFERQAAADPGALAVTFGGESWTYGDLDARANRLARRLRALGVLPGDLVGLCLHRTAALPAAILGVLKAGAAYLPLDPGYPAEHLGWMLADSGVEVLVTEEEALPLFPERTGLRILRLDGDRDYGETIAAESGEPPRVEISPEYPAYVIYTSGSTGSPKGVVVTHANVTRLLTATAPFFGFGPDDVWTLFHSYAFDFSVWEIWGALAHGGRLVVVPQAVTRSPEDFYRLLIEERVTVLNQTPSAFRQLVWAEEAVLAGAPPDLALRWVIFGGEALPPAILAPWFARRSGDGDDRPRLVNMYGITETTIHVTLRPLTRADAMAARGSRVGGPLPHLSLHVLDRLALQGGAFEPAPLGIPGEIHVGGAGLALGYLGRPDLTAERFVPDAFAGVGDSGARLYRTGDLARLLPDGDAGDIEYLGRIDHQVKIRGFRIELGEIESALLAHPAVREAVVVALGGPGSEQRLAAYVVPVSPASPPSASDLRAFLAGRLPEPMLPAATVVLDRLPLTANGKVDRRALPAPEGERPDSRAPHAEPRTDLERLLARHWQAALGVPSVGRDDSFFELGGSSVSGALLIHRLGKELGETLPVAAIFEAPTVAEMAGYLGRLDRRNSAASPPPLLVPLQPQGERPPLFCVHPGAGEVLAYADLARELGLDQPLYGFRAPGLYDGEPLLERVEEYAERAVLAFLRFAPTGPYRLGGWSFGGFVAFEMARQLAAAGREVALLALFDADAEAGERMLPVDDCELLAAAFHPHLPVDAAELRRMQPERRLPHVVGLARERGHRLADFDLDQARRYLAVFAATRRATLAYRPGPYPGRVTLFRAEEPPRASEALGWDRFAAGGVEIHTLPGHHQTLLTPPFVSTLARRLRESLDRL